MRLSFLVLVGAVVWSLFKFSNPKRDEKGKRHAAKGAAGEEERQRRKAQKEVRRREQERRGRSSSRRDGRR